ncbi:hypothetical protein NC653_010622 [Populus alba x Populus x berolinensis]|uniref:Uncharacterized protein n=1 Tax=Populus alba x Populus x berolinensis TaxID=444605 RepID=A0AAD6R0M4_9ROSI|nr:hypothetical protein NC653_010622 [Populus alba x Populus x berolinensis]
MKIREERINTREASKEKLIMHKARDRERERERERARERAPETCKKKREKEPDWYIKLNHWYCST